MGTEYYGAAEPPVRCGEVRTGGSKSPGIITKANGLAPMKYLKYILADMPGSTFLEHPEYLDDYLPWNPIVKELCQ